MKTKIGLLGLIMSVFFVGCNNDELDDAPMNSTDLTVNANMDAMSEDISSLAIDQYIIQANSVGKPAGGSLELLPECASVNMTTSDGNWIRTIDFGTEGCALKNGNVLKGKIIVTGSLNFNQSPYTIMCTFDKFFHNSFQVKGDKIMVRTLESTANLQEVHPVLTMTVNYKVISLNGVVRSMTGTRVREMIAGFDTPKYWLDDIFMITGTQAVVSPKGKITATITTPLKIELNCNYYVTEGVLEYTKGKQKATLDYGDGQCDNKAVCTVDGVAKNILLGTK